MIHFVIPLPPGLHQCQPRAPIIEAIRRAVGAKPGKRRYKTAIVLYAKWDKANGDPCSANTDNVVKVILDAMAEAFDFGKRGRGDEWLDRDYSVRAVDSPLAQAHITLIPM